MTAQIEIRVIGKYEGMDSRTVVLEKGWRRSDVSTIGLAVLGEVGIGFIESDPEETIVRFSFLPNNPLDLYEERVIVGGGSDYPTTICNPSWIAIGGRTTLDYELLVRDSEFANPVVGVKIRHISKR